MDIVKMFRKSEGFTLVELMVVVLIIGILVAIAVPVFKSAKDTAQKNTCFANQRIIDSAIMTKIASEDVAASTIDDIATALVTGGYLKTEPKCPANTDTYDVENGALDATKLTGHGSYSAQ